MRINLKAIGLGLLLYLGGLMVAGVLMGFFASILVPAFIQPEIVPDLSLPIILVIVELCFIFLGSFVAARTAKKDHMTHGLIIGVIGFLLGLFFKSGYPTWFNAISLILLLPVAAWGGSVAKRRQEKRSLDAR